MNILDFAVPTKTSNFDSLVNHGLCMIINGFSIEATMLRLTRSPEFQYGQVSEATLLVALTEAIG